MGLFKQKILFCLLLVSCYMQGSQEQKEHVESAGKRTMFNLLPEDIGYEISSYLDLYDIPKRVWANGFNSSKSVDGVLPEVDEKILTEQQRAGLGIENVVFAKYSPDNKHVYGIQQSPYRNFEVKAIISNVETKKQEHEICGFAPVDFKSAQFSADSSKFMIAAHNNVVYISDLSKAPMESCAFIFAPEIVKLHHSSKIMNAQFVPDSKTVTTVSKDGRIMLWDAQTGDLLHQFNDRINYRDNIKVSKDGTKIIVQATADKQKVFESSLQGALTLEQRAFLWLLDEYYQKLIAHNPKHSNKLLKLIAKIKHIDITELYKVFNTFSPAYQKAIRKAYDFDLSDMDVIVRLNGSDDSCAIC